LPSHVFALNNSSALVLFTGSINTGPLMLMSRQKLKPYTTNMVKLFGTLRGLSRSTAGSRHGMAWQERHSFPSNLPTLPTIPNPSNPSNPSNNNNNNYCFSTLRQLRRTTSAECLPLVRCNPLMLRSRIWKA
jgi:hypothetical protein